jgi:hypothetical protein
MKYSFWVGFQEKVFFVFWSLILLFSPMNAQNRSCRFDEKTRQFFGNPIEQAKCLLRPNQPRGILAPELAKLPKPLEKLIGQKVKIKKEKLRDLLRSNKIDELRLGGSLEQPLSKAKLPTGEEVQALYFIIHDTSTPNYGRDKFPVDINEKSWKFNNLEMWLKNPVAHIFVNRLGESITTTSFSEPVGKGWGTKLARDFLKTEGKGFQIHIELCQPRRSSPDWFDGNDEIAPEIGFTDQQYEKLALLYVCASIRRGTWLIPAYHSAIDAGIKGAHDDPQNFDLGKFAKFLQQFIEKF